MRAGDEDRRCTDRLDEILSTTRCLSHPVSLEDTTLKPARRSSIIVHVIIRAAPSGDGFGRLDKREKRRQEETERQRGRQAGRQAGRQTEQAKKQTSKQRKWEAMPRGRVAFVPQLAKNYCLPLEAALQQHQLMFGSKAVSCTRRQTSIRYTAAEHVLDVLGSTCIEVGYFTVTGVHPTHRLFKNVCCSPC